MGESEGPQQRSLWRRIAGDGTHIGFWTLPVFVATALGGAVIAGALANVYYAQQVDALEDETREARTAAETAAQDVQAARREALDAIDEQLDGVRDALEVARPLDDPAAQGVVALAVELTPTSAPSPSPSPSPAAQPSPSGTGGDGQPQGAPLAATEEEESGDQPDDGGDGAGATDGPTTPTDPPPPAPGARTRNAVGFAVAAADGATFVATTHGAVADPDAPDGVAVAVGVAGPGGAVRGVVHAWDEQRDVAVVRVARTDLQILPWRPAEAPVAGGDVVVLAAVTPGMVGVQLPGRVGAVTADVVVTDLPVDPVFDGAPLVDALGRVVAIQSSTAEPFGPGSAGAVAARQLCVELISGCELLEQADESDPVAEGSG